MDRRVDALREPDHVAGEVVEGAEEVEVDRGLGLRPEAGDEGEDAGDHQQGDVAGAASRLLVGVPYPGHWARTLTEFASERDHPEGVIAVLAAASSWYSSSSTSSAVVRREEEQHPRCTHDDGDDAHGGGAVGGVDERRPRCGGDLLAYCGYWRAVFTTLENDFVKLGLRSRTPCRGQGRASLATARFIRDRSDQDQGGQDHRRPRPVRSPVHRSDEEVARRRACPPARSGGAGAGRPGAGRRPLPRPARRTGAIRRGRGRSARCWPPR